MSTPSIVSPTPPITSPAASPSRRHRGLSYLRAYTQHRLSGSFQHSSPSAAQPTLASARPARLSISRSHSYPTSPTTVTSTQTTPQIEQNNTSRGQGPTNPESRALPGLNSSAQAPNAESAASVGRAAQGEESDMARNRTSNRSAPLATARQRETMTNGTTEDLEENGQPTIRFYPHQEIATGRPSLHFTPIVRTLPSQSSIIKVGRYSEREGIPVANPPAPSDAPVGFKSKVVSRKHCEFSFQNGSWHIKDVASSSGTFLNHVRLSQPNQQSRLFPVKDGDVVQLGIDFRGGEEMIFRCVKIRIECNRSWQQKPNKFNQERHAQLIRKKAEGQAAATGGENSGECAICLSSVMPCQSLFVAPCAHVWHFKCIYPLLIGKRYPHFACPNCRAIWNLEAEVDNHESDAEWEDAGQISSEPNQSDSSDQHNAGPTVTEASTASETLLTGGAPALADEDNDTSAITGHISMDEGHEEPVSIASRGSSSGLLARRQASVSAASHHEDSSVRDIELPDALSVTAPVDVPNHAQARINSPVSAADILSGEGPMTPRNNAGPFVFDGSAGRTANRRLQQVAAAEHVDP